MRKRLRHLPASLIASAVLLAVAVPLAWLLGGGVAALGAVAGVGLVAFSYLVSSLVVAWVDLVAREMLLVVALLTYTVKFAFLGVVMYHVNAAQWPGLFALGVTAIVSTIVWTGAQFFWIMRAKLLYVEIE